MSDQLARLSTEQWNRSIPPLETLDTLRMVQVINEEDQKVARAVEAVLPEIARAVDLVASVLAAGGRMLYIGAGTSGRIGFLDSTECPPTFNTDPETVQAVLAGGMGAVAEACEGVEDSEDAGAEDLRIRNVGPQDVVVGLAASGRTPYVMGALRFARQVGAATVAVSCNRTAEQASLADVAISVDTGPEVILGSTRMKAGTAQKLVLNMLSTGAMVRLGKTYRNLMVDMKPTNYKLVERARRMVRLAADLDDEDEAAAQVLAASGNQPKVAIFMVQRGTGRAEAEAALARAHGDLRRALEESAGLGGKG